MSLSISSAIQDLQPVIDRLSLSCSESNIHDLKHIITLIPSTILQQLHSYILVPVFGELIDDNHGVKIKSCLLECAFSVLSAVHLPDVSTVLNLLNVLMIQLFDKNSPTMLSAVPEEMKLSTLRCALAILDNMTPAVRDDFFNKRNIPLICQISYTCVQVAQSEKLRVLRICAMEVILSLLQVPKNGETELLTPYRKKIGDIFQFVLPGASAKLSSIVAGDVTQGSQVILTAVWTLSTMIAIVMEDDDLEQEDKDVFGKLRAIFKNNRKLETSTGQNEAEIHVSKDRAGMEKLINSSPGRTAQWKSSVSRNLIPHLKKIAALHSHSNPKVCREVARSCGLLLLQCPLSLREGLSPLLDALIILSVHEDHSVRQESDTAILRLRESCMESKCNNFLELVEENFFMLLTRLPRIVQEDGGSRSIPAISLLTGYVHLLKPSMKRVLSSSVHLQRLTLSLLQSLSLDCSGINVGQEYAIRKMLPAQGEDFKLPWTQLRFDCNCSALSSFNHFCKVLADPVCSAVEMFGSQLMDTFSAVPFYQKECVLALNSILVASSQYPSDDLQQFALSVLDLYLAPDIWISAENLCLVTSIHQLQKDIAFACLLAEGLGCCAYALGAERTKSLLLRILYPLLERAGSANSSLSLAGQRALTKISIACGYGTDLMALIADNMDYVTHCMVLRLRHYGEQHGVFDALSMILQHTSPDIAIGFRSVVYSVLHQSESVNNVKSHDAHLRVFLTFAHGVHQWLEPKWVKKDLKRDKVISVVEKLKKDPYEDKSPSMITTFLPISSWKALQNFKKYQLSSQLNMIEESCNSSNEICGPDYGEHQTLDKSDEETEEEFPEEPKKEDIPELAKLLVAVLQRCIHFLPVNVVDHQFLALETLQAGLLALKPYPDTLLPIVHQIWSPLLGRLRANQPPLIIRSGFQLLLVMARVAQDFLLKRTLKEVLPHFNTFLKNSAHNSHMQDQGAAFRLSQMYKTQHALLTGLGPLARHMKFQGQDFYSVLVSTLPYLSRYQPQPLQAACRGLVQAFSELDADATWWALVSWWTPPSLAPILQLPKTSQNQDCKENVAAILNLYPGNEV